MNSTLLFTPAALMDLLTQIEELKDKEIEINESSDGSISLQIGESTYKINSSDAAEIEADDYIIDAVDDINMEAYEEVQEKSEDEEPVTSGMLKELVKSLMLGGMIRLSKKLLD